MEVDFLSSGVGSKSEHYRDALFLKQSNPISPSPKPFNLFPCLIVQVFRTDLPLGVTIRKTDQGGACFPGSGLTHRLPPIKGSWGAMLNTFRDPLLRVCVRGILSRPLEMASGGLTTQMLLGCGNHGTQRAFPISLLRRVAVSSATSF